MRSFLSALCLNIGLVFLLWFLTDLTGWECAAVALFIYNLSGVIYRFGRTIILIDLIVCVAALELLFMPAIYYHLFPLSMAVSGSDYFQFVYPATVAMQIGLTYPICRLPSYETYLQNVRIYLAEKTSVIYYLIFTGFMGVVIGFYVPDGLKTLFIFFVSCAKVGALYAYFSSSHLKYGAMFAVLAILLLNTVLEGMFGELFFWLILWAIYISAGNSWLKNLFNKFILLIIGTYFLLLIQSLKFEYRTNTWGATQQERTGNIGLMLALISDRIQNPSRIFAPEAVAISTARFNQGSLLSAAMAHVPRSEPYANGEVLQALIIPIIPRLIWPNKPMTGGHENIRRFTALPQYLSTSINISPVGEAYVNFGLIGGVLYMLFFGLFFNYWHHKLLWWAADRPTVVLWLPMLFYSALNMDTDLLSIWGTLLVNGILLILFYRFSDAIGFNI